MRTRKWIKNGLMVLAAAGMLTACKKDTAVIPVAPPVTPPVTPPAFDINSINDTYADVAPFANYQLWASHNVHDPAIIKEGDYYYAFGTDVGYGIDVRSGIQVRKSKDLVEWTFEGWVFNSLPALGAAIIRQGGEAHLSIHCGRPVL